MCDEYIAVGRRSLLCGEITKAVENFQKACELIAAEHGDLDERLAEPNLLYGSALLELARMEGPVLGNALDGVPEEDDEDENDIIEKGPEMTADEKEDLSNQVIDAMCEESKEETDKQNEETDSNQESNGKSGEGVAGEEGEEAAAKEEEEEKAEDEEEEDAVDADAADGEGSSTGEAADEQCDDEDKPDKEVADSDNESEDVSNLQLAWEVIEVAKRIFSQSESKEHKLKVADCLEKLAEISREKEDYEQAMTDLQECMNIRSDLLASDSREVAETHFQMGTTHAVSGQLESASLAFQAALKCLKEYSTRLQVQLDESKEDEEKESLRATLKDINELIPDVERRCAEVEEDRTAGVADTKISPPTATKKENVAPGDDISHLIRKKRPVTDETKEIAEKAVVPETNGTPINKKAKLEEVGSHELKANGDDVNGNSKVDVVTN